MESSNVFLVITKYSCFLCSSINQYGFEENNELFDFKGYIPVISKESALSNKDTLKKAYPLLKKSELCCSKPIEIIEL